MLDKDLCLRSIESKKDGVSDYIGRHVEASNQHNSGFELHRLSLSVEALNEFPGGILEYVPSAGRLNNVQVFVDATVAIANGKTVPDNITRDEYERLKKEIVKAIKPYGKIQTNELVTTLGFKQVANFHQTNRLVATLEFRGA
jgi:hypothetical protein